MKTLFFRTILNFISDVLRSASTRFDRSPIASVETLAHFARTRSSYVAQTALFGYLKTRMGTRFRVLFEDDVFSAEIRRAAVKLFISCLGDLTVFSVALVSKKAALSPAEAEALARDCFGRGLSVGLNGLDSKDIPPDATEKFEQRVSGTDWARAGEGETAFAGSAADLIRVAPVVDTFKELDREIVTNSIRFRWRDVRDQARKRLDPVGVRDDWMDRQAPDPVA